MDRPLAEVFGDLGARVVGAERLLVDVLLEDVAEHVGVDLVVLAAGRVVEVPGVASKRSNRFSKALSGTSSVRVVLLDLVRQEQAAVEVADLADELAVASGERLSSRLGEAFEEEQLEEVAVKYRSLPRSLRLVPACLAGNSRLPPSRKPFFWRK